MKEILRLLQINSAKLKATRMSRAQILCVCNNYDLIKFTHRIQGIYIYIYISMYLVMKPYIFDFATAVLLINKW